MCKRLLGGIHVGRLMYVYLGTIIVKESNVHANKASQGIEKKEQMPLVWPHRKSKRELESRTPALQ